jgi:hypothetical protein
MKRHLAFLVPTATIQISVDGLPLSSVLINIGHGTAVRVRRQVKVVVAALLLVTMVKNTLVASVTTPTTTHTNVHITILVVAAFIDDESTVVLC